MKEKTETFSVAMNGHINHLLATSDKYEKSKFFKWYYDIIIGKIFDYTLDNLSECGKISALVKGNSLRFSKLAFDTEMLEAKNVDVGVYALKRELDITGKQEPANILAKVCLEDYHDAEIMGNNCDSLINLINAYKSSYKENSNMKLSSAKEYYAYRNEDATTKKAMKYLSDIDTLTSSPNYVAREVGQFMKFITLYDMFDNISARFGKNNEINYTLSEYDQLCLVDRMMNAGYKDIVKNCSKLDKQYAISNGDMLDFLANIAKDVYTLDMQGLYDLDKKYSLQNSIQQNKEYL